MRKNKSGFTLIEILLTLSITIALLSTAFYIYQKVKAEFDIRAEINGASSMASEVKSVYRGSKGYYGLSNYLLYNMKAFPEKFKVDKSKFNSLSGAYSVLGAQFTTSYSNVHLSEGSNEEHMGDQSAFDMIYSGINTAYCYRFVSGMSAYSNAIQIDGTLVKRDIPLTAKGHNKIIKFNSQLANNLCNTSKSHVLVFIFY